MFEDVGLKASAAIDYEGCRTEDERCAEGEAEIEKDASSSTRSPPPPVAARIAVRRGTLSCLVTWTRFA